MYKILTLNPISVKGLERFPRDRYEIASEIGHPDAILVRSARITPEDLTPSVKAIARAGAGVDKIPVEYCTQRCIPVIFTPGANANAVKELVLTGLLLASRGILEGARFVNTLVQKNLDKAELNQLVEKEKRHYRGKEISGKSLGIVGLGAIGSMVAETALSLGMEVRGYDPALSLESAWRLSNRVQRMDNLHSLLAKSDYVTLHLPLMDQTHHLISREALADVKKGCSILNFARGEIVDAEALLEALKDERLSRYVTDFPDPLLIGRDDVITLPHIGASTLEAEENCAVMAADQLMDFLENGNIRFSVNFPQIFMERNGGNRIALSNQNVPKMLGKILNVLADKDLNVIDMINKSRGEIAYNLIDLESTPPSDLIPDLEALEGIISVRIL